MAFTHSSPLLVLRADASSEIGSGHVMRCLALARAWRRRGGEFRFVARTMGDPLVERVVAAGGSVCWLGAAADANETASIAAAAGAVAVVIDGYQFTVHHDRACRAAGLLSLVVDDNAEHGRFESDFVLNQNIHASPDLYLNRSSQCELLLGLEYAMLRDEFIGREAKVIVEHGRCVLLSFGASDVAGLSLAVLDALAVIPSNKRYRLVIGPLHPDINAVISASTRCVGVELLFDVRTMSEQMEWADVAVLAAGSTIWEAAACGVPTLAVVVAENQAALAREAERRGVVRLLGRAGALSGAQIVAAIDELAEQFEERKRQSVLARRLVDGRGADRVVSAILERANAAP